MENINSISPESNEFLQRTAVIAKVPKRLWYIGKLPAAAPTVAIVGSRKPTAYGQNITLRLAVALAARGVIIVSGLALGIDGLAARGALDGGGITVAVIGNGLAKIHPHTNQHLADEIVAAGGAIVSEYPPDTPVYRGNFLWRNRLIAALADVVVVVEAGEKSGSLNTAAHALAQNKELMAVPGNITSPLSIGCNRLIAQGATPLLSVDDCMEKLREIYATRGETVAKKFLATLEPAKSVSRNLQGDDAAQTAVLRALADGAADGDDILRATKLSAADYSVALTMLEIAGRVQALGANKWSLK